ncbi:hypothetical protein Ahy_B06g082127 isoform B [Arachis hypogaea]|uniref:Uncharacterized protein n=1 Tax=Arachis hypogaea TaxID=3818 RepID=A0A444YMU2_ARAHY|nr:hypothetical protein Ahy_B06g082127 isoform B [Arachis hypogaea]
MPEKSWKVPFTEQDSAKLLERYDATTVLTLLQKLAHYPHAKIDWNELVKNTSTGISTAREYQMAFRAIYLVYGDYLKSWYTKGPKGKRNIDALLLES